MDTGFFDGLDSRRVAEASCIVDADEVLVETRPGTIATELRRAVPVA